MHLTAAGQSACHLKHEPGNDFCLLPDVSRQEFASLLSQVDHDGSRLKDWQITLVMIHCMGKQCIKQGSAPITDWCLVVLELSPIAGILPFGLILMNLHTQMYE